MTTLCHIALSPDGGTKIPLQELGPSHGLTPTSAKMYDRFFGLQSVTRHRDAQTGMLSPVLQGAIDSLPDRGRSAGLVVYCKTQTHNTRTDQNWLRQMVDQHGLAHWDVHALSMTSCASALACLHFVTQCGTEAPVIVLTGEKAFHPSVSRLTVGLLAEVPTAAVLNAGPGSWHVHGTAVRHLPRFHINPEAMGPEDRLALQQAYAPGLTQFVASFLDRHAAVLSRDMIFVPHNLNRPLTDALIRAFDWQDRTFQGDIAGTGHAYCSDPFVNLEAVVSDTGPVQQVLLLAAGTGVTFSACLLDRDPPACPAP
ncbi:3-oxoacyl-[acyl-carrier-protein] synthase III C-terminal domain-containing protein [Epibacterium sp. Ofav1-8]|uniref:3-oxoacyl-[acyl-carrier-protein] synthase III C-terminal domain-containing protein n=1 Tax=Epibacterium sp. Ofav1-8 TaxID=2917735 RepID=UPI001EF5ABDD|nr:3-oxoacyl-[acyl-carrier-protein] synthase III C-terminal domain-containing protein [Epibacterium sp. Ofav1-8]MCG7622252.1 hypothetical protein [Epibacterium sp. Ofav1-8]